MRKASTLFSEDDRQRIQAAVVEAEAKTAAEIVPVVAAASGRYDRSTDIVGLWFGLVAMTAVWFSVPVESDAPGAWGGVPPLVKGVLLIAAVVVGFLAGIVAAHHWGWLRRLFTPRHLMREEVHGRAEQAFFDARLRQTAGGTGVLIYVSLFERHAAVLGDKAVMEHLGQAGLDRLCAQLTDALKTRPPTDALLAVIKSAGEAPGPRPAQRRRRQGRTSRRPDHDRLKPP